MKILILVQSIDLPNKPEYERLRQAQLTTWDSVPHPDIDVIYYTPGIIEDKLEGNRLHIACDTHWSYMFFNLAKAMRHMLKHDQTWDYIFKTDNSAYIDKARLHQLLLHKPREKFYGGMLFPFKAPNDISLDFMWGDGYALSRDMVAHIVSKYNAAPLKGRQEDDRVIAQLMYGVANWDGSLKIYLPGLNKNIVELGHHAYRCRIDHTSVSPAATNYTEINKIIDNDIMMMNKIYNTLIHGQTTNNEGILTEVQDKA